jgi:hypothetical protein
MTDYVNLVNATFQPPTPGADPASRRFGRASPDSAGDIGEDQYWPQPATMTAEQRQQLLNPLQHLPVVGTFYRLVTKQSEPQPMQIADSVVAGLAFGGPVGAIGTAVLCFAEELIRMGPDQSGAAAPAGMTVAGSEAGVQPITPGEDGASPAGAPNAVMMAGDYAATRMLETGIV